MRFPEHPSLFRKALLAPLSLAYGVAAAAHRALWLKPRFENRAGLPPLAVIGSLRAGGAGKTAVTIAAARALRSEGFRVGILVYAIRAGGGAEKKGIGRDIAHEIAPDSDWRASSDEAVLLARESGARVFATRDRERAWATLGRTGDFDLLLSDDGLMDSRLKGAHRFVVARAGENPGWTDLLPAGPYRLRASFLARAHGVLREGADFTRTPAPPPEWRPERDYWVLAGLGDPAGFARALRGAGVRVAGLSAGPDHGLPNLRRARAEAGRAGVDRFVCSAKDAVKLEGHPDRPPILMRIGERIELSLEFRTTLRNLVPGGAPTS